MDADRLINILNNTKLQQTNNAEYQVIKGLIDIIKTQQTTINSLTSVDGISAQVTTASLVGKTMTFIDGKLTKFL